MSCNRIAAILGELEYLKQNVIILIFYNQGLMIKLLPLFNTLETDRGLATQSSAIVQT